jgi:chromosome segregation ATPase
MRLDLAQEVERLRRENARLASDLAQVHRQIIPWIEKASQLKADLDLARDALPKEAHAEFCAGFEAARVQLEAAAEKALTDYRSVMKAMRAVRSPDPVLATGPGKLPER